MSTKTEHTTAAHNYKSCSVRKATHYRHLLHCTAITVFIIAQNAPRNRFIAIGRKQSIGRNFKEWAHSAAQGLDLSIP
jgi:hypothetical protein